MLLISRVQKVLTPRKLMSRRRGVRDGGSGMRGRMNLSKGIVMMPWPGNHNLD